MKKIAGILLMSLIVSACNSSSMKGTWQYDGGIYNGTARKAATEFRMQRTYTADSYEGHLLEGTADTRYTAGKYRIKADTLYLTSTFSSSPSQLLGKTQAYHYKIEGPRLTIKGVLPNGMQVEEYWKKVK